jgi:hypothetical protein
MKGSDRDFIFNALIKVSDLLLKECESLGEIIECPEDAVNVSKRVIAHNEEIIESVRELNFNFGESLFEEVEARFIYLIIEAAKECSEKVEEVSRCFVRYNIEIVRDNCVSSILDMERAAKTLNKLILKLRDKKKTDSPYKYVIELEQFLIEQKKIYDINVRKLFTKETDPVEIVKWERLYTSIYDVFKSYECVSATCAKYNLAWC